MFTPKIYQLTESRRDRLSKYLKEQFEKADGAFDAYRLKWDECLARHEAKSVATNFPWKGACSVHLPFVAITVDAVKAKLKNGLLAQPDRMIVGEPLSEETIPGFLTPSGEPVTWRFIAEQLERYMDWEISPNGDVDLYNFIDDSLDEALIFGNCVGKTVWSVEGDIDPESNQSMVSYDNVRFISVPIETIRIPTGYYSLENIPWISQVYRLRPAEVRMRIQTHGWSKAEIIKFLGGQLPEAELSSLEEKYDDILQSISIPSNEEVDICETWMRFDLDGNGKELKILVDHLKSDPSVIFRVQQWPYENGKLPFYKFGYIKRRKQFWNKGIAEQVEQIDEALTTVFRQMVDNVTIANTRVWLVNANSEAMRHLDLIYPGKKVPCTDPKDILPLQMGEVYPSIFELLNITRDYGERVTKLTDYNLGRESQALGKQGTATTTLALLQESGQFYEDVNRTFRLEYINEGLQRWVDLIVQSQPAERMKLVLGANAESVCAVLSYLTPSDLRKRIAIRIAFSNTAASRELARQEEQAKLGSLTNFYSGLLSLAQTRMANPALSPLVDSIARDAQFHMKKFMSSYGELSSPTTIPSWDLLVQQMEKINEQIGINQLAAGSQDQSGVDGNEVQAGGEEEVPAE